MILGWQFQGKDAPACIAASDVDVSGEVELTDAIRLLNWLFQGSAAPPSPNTLTSIWNFGGATARVPAEATAFGDRSMPYMFSIDSIWTEAADDEANIAWTRDLWDRMSPHSQNGRMYLNFPGMGEEGERLLRNTFGANYDRLAEVKRKYDPENRFRFNQNIEPA